MNNFALFYVTHIAMTLAMVALLIIHPYPGRAANTPDNRSNTWAYLLGGVMVYVLGNLAQAFR